MRIDPVESRRMVKRARTRTGRGPWAQLLSQLLELAGDEAELVRHSERPWASVTFSGSRHTVVLAFPGAQGMDKADEFIAALPEHEFTIARRIVADAAVTGVEQVALPEPRTTVEAELLLLDDA